MNNTAMWIATLLIAAPSLQAVTPDEIQGTYERELLKVHSGKIEYITEYSFPMMTMKEMQGMGKLYDAAPKQKDAAVKGQALNRQGRKEKVELTFKGPPLCYKRDAQDMRDLKKEILPIPVDDRVIRRRCS